MIEYHQSHCLLKFGIILIAQNGNSACADYSCLIVLSLVYMNVNVHWALYICWIIFTATSQNIIVAKQKGGSSTKNSMEH